MENYNKKPEEVLRELNTDENGLTEEEAKSRAEKYGKNMLDKKKPRSIALRFLDQLADPMIIVLLVAAALSVITAVYQDESFADVIIILAVVIINSVLGVVQENNAEKALEALQKISAATSKAVRGGHQTTVNSDVLVPGDIVVLEAGDAVPADCRIIECASLKAEESALTGESVPVEKTTDAIAGDKVPLGDRRNMLYSGSTIAYGRGKAVVCATGMSTELGKIAGAIADAGDDSTPLQKKLSQLSKILTIAVVAICLIIFAISAVREYPNITMANMADTFMLAVSLAVAAIPEGLAAVVTIVLSMGVTKMSKKNAIVRKLTAVEALGCAQVICSDKTGTLTQNKMTVVDSYGDKKLTAKLMALCCDAQIGEDLNAVGEPTECALVNFAYKEGISKDDLNSDCPRVGEAPFDSMRKMMSTVHRLPDGTVLQSTKGGLDVVLAKCDTVLINGREEKLTEKLKSEIMEKNADMASRSLRVLCCAQRVWKEAPADFSSQNLEKNLCFVGIVGMIDPVRPEVKDAIKQCGSAGIRPVMITGDHIDTAVAIAKELGIIKSADEAVTGAQLDEMSDKELEGYVAKYSVYARVQPEHKVRIVNAWRKKGMITAMTGDGVNDAPSIKNADIGIGMGITGTDVTKDVADMILADDNFATIVVAVEEGRRIYDNIRRTVQFLLSSNLAEVIAIFFASLFGVTLLQAVHLLWINLITDSIPALALGTEDAEKGIMRRKPRSSSAGLFADGLSVNVVIHGVIIAVITVVSYLAGHRIESGAWEFVTSSDGMTMAFLTLSLTEMFHAFNMRSIDHSIFTLKKQNVILWLAMGASLILTTAVIFIKPLAVMFEFESISAVEYLVAAGLAVTIIPIVEITKAIQRGIQSAKK